MDDNMKGITVDSPEGKPKFSFAGYKPVSKDVFIHKPIEGNKGIPICIYCWKRHPLKQITVDKRELFNGICIEYQEKWYLCEVTGNRFATSQMSDQNDKSRNEAYEGVHKHSTT